MIALCVCQKPLATNTMHIGMEKLDLLWKSKVLFTSTSEAPVFFICPELWFCHIVNRLKLIATLQSYSSLVNQPFSVHACVLNGGADGGERLVTLDSFLCAIGMQLTYHLQKDPRLLLNKMSAMNCCSCDERLDRRKSLHTPAS